MKKKYSEAIENNFLKLDDILYILNRLNCFTNLILQIW